MSNNLNKKTMKKLFAIIAIAGIMTACNNEKKTEDVKMEEKMDVMKDKMQDTMTKKMDEKMDNMKDTMKMKMEEKPKM